MRLRECCTVFLLIVALSIEATYTKEVEQCNKKASDSGKMWRQKRDQDHVEKSKEEEGQDEVKTVGSKRIFIYNPYLGYHHTHFMTTIANALDAAGHQVTMLDSLIYPELKQPKRRETIRVLTVGQNALTRKIAEDGESEKGLKSFWSEPPLATKVKAFFSFYKSVTGFSSMMAAQCEEVLKSDALKILRKESFDLAISEVFDFCGVGLNAVIDVKKTMLASSVPLHEYIGEKLGLPKTFDIVPTKFTTTTAKEHRENFNKYERSGLVKNILESAILGQNIFGYLEMKETVIFQNQFPDVPFPGFEKLLRSAHSLIENVHPLLDLSKPTLNAIIPIGGITIYKSEKEQYSDKEAAEMGKIMNKILNAKKHNSKVVLVSFGTVMDISTMKDEIKQNLLHAFNGVEDTIFFWKAKRELLSRIEIPSNVHLYDWLPQSDLLASGEIDLFVSHMGIGSMTEAAYNGVPMISVPIFVDQHYNFACAKRLKIADFVDKYSLQSTSEELRAAIQKELNSGAMKANSKRLAVNLKKFGNQTKKMLDHMDFILSLPDDTESNSFQNHHQGMSLMLTLRSLLHFVPYYAVPITTMIFIITFINLGYIAWCCSKGVEYMCSKKHERTTATASEANGVDPQQHHGNNNELPIENGKTIEPAQTKTSSTPILTAINDINLDVAVEPFPMFPAMGGFCKGIVCDWSVPIQYSFATTVLLLGNIGASILICISYRHQSLVRGRFKLSERLIQFTRFIVVVFYSSPGILSFSLYFDTTQTEVLIDNYKFGNLTWMRERGMYVFFVRTIGMNFVLPVLTCTVLTVAIVLLFAMIGHIVWSINRDTHRSEMARNRNKRALFILTVQLVVPMALLIVPAYIIMVAFIWEDLIPFEVCQVAFFCLYPHTFTHSVVLILITPTYRALIAKHLRRLMFWKRGTSVSITEATQSAHFK